MQRWSSILALSGLAVAATAQAASIPYTNDFSSQADDFTTSGTTTWAVSGGTLNHSHTAGGNWTALADFPALGGAAATASDFAFTAKVAAANANGTNTYVSLAALGTTATNGYQFRIQGAVGGANNGITIVRSGTVVAGAGGTSVQLRNQLNVPFEIVVSGTYTDTNADTIKDALQLSYALYRRDTNALLGTATYLDTAPLTGTRVGFYDNNANTEAFNIAWNDITVVPEPASLSALLVGGLALLRRRR